jgi:hypothetical protein
MTRPFPFPRRLFPAALAAIAAAISPAASASASPEPEPVRGGRIGTLPIGTYSCEMPGDAGGAAGKPVADHSFKVVNASSYKADGIRGSYLLTGTRVTMTGGKLKGLVLHRISTGFLRQQRPDGSDGDMRCVMTSRRATASSPDAPAITEGDDARP